VNVAVNPPVFEETTEVGEVIRVSPSKLRVIVEFAAKPEPVIVIVEPTLPAAGFNENRGPTVKKAEAESANVSVAVTM
jgi:ArsR family metal-binding transcriptional regulator